MTKQIKVSGLDIDEKVFPKLYELGKEDFKRLEMILSLARDHCPTLSALEVARKVESAKPMTVMGKIIGVFEFPAIYCWYSQNKEGFEKFFKETVVELWGGDKETAFKMMEEYFERGSEVKIACTFQKN